LGGRFTDPAVGLAEGPTPMTQKQWPATIDEAVGVVIATLPDDEKAKIAALSEPDLIGLHFGLAPGFATTLVSIRKTVNCWNRRGRKTPMMCLW
jgi:hypothetical protein